MTEASLQALENLRDPALLKWYVVPLFAFVIYVYAVEVERKNWRAVLAGLAFWGMDIFNEIWNSLLLHLSGRSACWTAPGDTAYLIFVGLNIEISLMFAVAGLVFVKMLPEERTLKIWGMPNRWFMALANSFFCVFVEILLNRAGLLVWEYSWWNFPHVWLIVLLGYMPFMIAAFTVYDMTERKKQLAVVGVILGVDLLAILIFGVGLGWL